MKKLFLMCAALLAVLGLKSAPDPNFHIYLCLGQSNMEGNASIETVDLTNVPERFRTMAAVDYTNPQRSQYGWYTAVPPLVREYTGLSPADWFGRAMVDNMPDDVKVGVVVVAIGGCKIEHLDKDYDDSQLVDEADWFKNFMKAYDNHPYQRLLECAKRAQQDGVIKGILLHQGESNTGDQQWPAKVNKIYTDLLTDLNLKAEDVPLLAGEVVTSDQGGVCGSMNAIINTLPQTIPTAHVISASNLPQKGDGLHFTPHAYRVLGGRYATAMLATMGIDDPVINYVEEEAFVPTPTPSEGDFVFDTKYFNPSIWEKGTWEEDTHTFVAGQWGFGGWQYDKPIDLSGYQYLVAELYEPQSNGAELRVFDTQSYWESCYTRAFGDKTLLVSELRGMMKPVDMSDASKGITAVNTAGIYRVGFWAYGGKPIRIKQVYATNVDPYAQQGVTDVVADTQSDCTIYNLQGIKVADMASIDALPSGIYIFGGTMIRVR